MRHLRCLASPWERVLLCNGCPPDLCRQLAFRYCRGSKTHIRKLPHRADQHEFERTKGLFERQIHLQGSTLEAQRLVQG